MPSPRHRGRRRPFLGRRRRAACQGRSASRSRSAAPPRPRATCASMRSSPRRRPPAPRPSIRGFGFLAENAAFARAVEAAGLVFIGPTAEVDRAAGRQGVRQAGSRSALACRSCRAARRRARMRPKSTASCANSSLPVMLKAAAGGGGKGMRAVIGLRRSCRRNRIRHARGEKFVRLCRLDRRKAGRARPPYRGADRRRRQRQCDPSVRARMLVAAAASESHRGSAGRPTVRRRCAKKSPPTRCGSASA